MDEKLQKQVQELEKEYDKYLPYSARYDLAKDEAFLNYLTYMIEEQNVKNKELRIPQNEFIDDESLPSYMIVGVNGLREILYNHAEQNYINEVNCRFYFKYKDKYYTILNSYLDSGTTVFDKWDEEDYNDKVSTFNIIEIEDILNNKDNEFKDTNRKTRMINEIKDVIKRYNSNSTEVIDLLQFMNICNVIK